MTTATELIVTEWRKSSYSTNGGNCLEIGEGNAQAVPVRDSKVANGPIVVFTTGQWADFVTAVQQGSLPN